MMREIGTMVARVGIGTRFSDDGKEQGNPVETGTVAWFGKGMGYTGVCNF